MHGLAALRPGRRLDFLDHDADVAVAQHVTEQPATNAAPVVLPLAHAAAGDIDVVAYRRDQAETRLLAHHEIGDAADFLALVGTFRQVLEVNFVFHRRALRIAAQHQPGGNRRVNAGFGGQANQAPPFSRATPTVTCNLGWYVGRPLAMLPASPESGAPCASYWTSLLTVQSAIQPAAWAPAQGPLRLLIVTDAWTPQVNGVVRTLEILGKDLAALGHEVRYATPEGRRTLPLPTYPEIRLALFPRRAWNARSRDFAPDAVHIATEGPLGWRRARICLKHGIAFTTAFHTRFPEYVHARFRWCRKSWSGAGCAGFTARPPR